MILRIVFTFALLLSILFCPFWVSIILALTAIIYFRFFWEAIGLFFISDLLFGMKESRFLNITLISTIFVTVMLLLIEFIKRKLKFYQK
jgi:hypothetical protein